VLGIIPIPTLSPLLSLNIKSPLLNISNSLPDVLFVDKVPFVVPLLFN